MEKKTFELKDASISDAGQLQGYGAAYGNVDSYGDLIAPMSCKNVQEFIEIGCLAVGHNWGGLGVATIDDARDTDKGLWLSATYHTDEESQRARTIAKERLERGKFVGLSIGYQVVDSSTETRDGQEVRLIKGYNVYEVSQVLMPANMQAGATSAKSFEDRSEGVFATLAELSTEWKRIRALRVKDGRNWPSEFNRSRIEAFAAKCDELHQAFRDLLIKSGEEPSLATDDEISEVRRAMAKHRLAMAGLGASK